LTQRRRAAAAAGPAAASGAHAHAGTSCQASGGSRVCLWQQPGEERWWQERHHTAARDPVGVCEPTHARRRGAMLQAWR
jgi:hypothetical protein